MIPYNATMCIGVYIISHTFYWLKNIKERATDSVQPTSVRLNEKNLSFLRDIRKVCLLYTQFHSTFGHPPHIFNQTSLCISV
ncbi:unnamed protein product [Candida parapsilosis]